MPISVVPYSESWSTQFDDIKRDLRAALGDLDVAIEHVGSTAVPGLAAKPIIDIDIIVDPSDVERALEALSVVGYTREGDLGLAGREAVAAPDNDPERHVYVCAKDSLHVRNHLAVRDALRADPDLSDRYGQLKLQLGSDPNIDAITYGEAKSTVLQDVLARSDISRADREAIGRMNATS